MGRRRSGLELGRTSGNGPLMPQTTNYEWTTPADTDFVTNGALAIRTIGNSVDSTVNKIENFKGENPHPFLLMGV